MHKNGEKIAAALKKLYPALDLKVGEADLHHILTVAFVSNGKRFVARTPSGLDYREMDYRDVIHMLGEQVLQKVLK